MDNTLPLLDNIVNHLKNIMLNCTIKNPKYADKYETQMSLKLSSIYLSILKGTSRFESFPYTYLNFYEACSDILSENEIIYYFNNKDLIPENIRRKIYEYYKNDFLNKYIELNEYYRELNGNCKFDRSNEIYLTKDDIGDLTGIDISIPVHEMDTDMQDILISFKIVDKLISRYGYKYLSYLGSNKKDIFTLRTSPDYSLLGIEAEAPDELINRFKERYDINKNYILLTVYSDAFKLESDYYEEFIIMMILTQTASDILAEIPDIINKREMFDLKTIKLFFNSIGVEYFPSIPYRYQIAMVRNFHRLLINKSTTQSILDILRIFGMKNIDVFKYYLVKRRKLDEEGNYISTGDTETDFNLEFLKCPIDSNPDDYLHDDKNFSDYNDITNGDIYWNGDLTVEENELRHLSHEYNYIASKYLSVDVMNDINDMNFHLIYFYNILYDGFIHEDKLLLSIPFLSTTHMFKLVDIFSFLTALAYEFNGFEDNLIDLTEKVLYIKGFNFETDMDEIVELLNNNKMVWKDLGILEFIRSESEIITHKKLVHMFNNNIITLKGLIKLINNAENKKMFDIFTKIYESLYIMELNDKFYKNTIGYYPKTHTEFISKRDGILHEFLLSISKITDESAKKEQISLIIEYVVFALETTIPELDFTYIFKDIPTVSLEAIQKYILYVINFYKSFKTQILNINSKMHLNDALDNKVNIVEDVKYDILIRFKDFHEIVDKIIINGYFKFKEILNLDDTIYIKYIYGEIDKYMNDELKILDKFNIRSYIKNKEYINIHDKITIERIE